MSEPVVTVDANIYHEDGRLVASYGNQRITLDQATTILVALRATGPREALIASLAEQIARIEATRAP